MQTKTLNLLDIIGNKRNLFWGKYYFGAFERGGLINTILFSFYFGNLDLVEIHNVENKDREFLNQFTHEYATKKQIKYFIRELDESTEINDIEFMNSCGFKRFNRNYCFEYNVPEDSLQRASSSVLFCRELEDKDIFKLIEIDTNSQILEYRDSLFKGSKFFRERINDIYVFVDSQDFEKIYAFAFKKNQGHNASFEFIIHPRQTEILDECIKAFAEKYIHFDKHSNSFRFMINENQKSHLETLQKHYKFINSTQLLIKEGSMRDKVKKTSGNFAFSKATVG